MTRSRKKAILIGCIIAALPVLFLVEEHFRGKWSLAKYRRQLVAKGEKLTVDECRPSVPDAADNGFGDFTSAVAMLASGGITDHAPLAMRMVAPGKAQVIYNVPEWPMRNQNTRGPMTNSNWKLLEESLAASRDPLEAAKAALRKPVIFTRLNYSLVRFDALSSSYLVPARKTALCLSADALHELHHARLDAVIDSIESNLRLSQAMRDDRMLIGQLVRIAIAAIAVGPTWQALHTPGWNDTQLARLQQVWQTNDFLPPMIASLDMERAMGNELIREMRDSAKAASDYATAFLDPMNAGTGASAPKSFDDLTENIGERGNELLVRGLYVPVWQFAWSHDDEKNHLEILQRVLDGARASAAQHSMRPSFVAEKELEKRTEQQTVYARMKHFCSGMLGAALTRSFIRAATVQTQRDMAVTAIALKRHERRHGRLPPELGALVPEFLPAVPRDIFDVQPLRYRPNEGGGFLLYSVGRDEKDDGGDPKPESGSNSFFFNGRDLVWPQPATPEEITASDEKENGKRKK